MDFKNSRTSAIYFSSRRVSQFILDIFIFIFAYLLAFIIRFETIPSGIHLKQFLLLFPYIALARIISFALFSIYSIVWRYISIGDAMSIMMACVPVSVVLLGARLFFPERLPVLRIPLCVIALEFLLALIGTLGVRMIRRFHFENAGKERFGGGGNTVQVKNTLLVGAGNTGNAVVRELKKRADHGFDIIGFVDDDPLKYKTVIQGVKVLGNTSQIPEFVKKFKIEEVIISIANATSKEIRRIVAVCEGTSVTVKIVPGLLEILDDKIKITKIREIDITDLLGRSKVDFGNNIPDVVNHYKSKRILVTGAGGSIGSELCRQLAAMWPKELILLDKDENSIFEIDNELGGRLTQSSQRNVYPVISNIKNRERLECIFKKYKPEVIFHAAAHKHVPLMECNVSEAIINNVWGTKNVVELADLYGLEKVIFISTDKAVNPVSVMGATKKIGEIIIQEVARRSKTKYACVRFGNVLGSRGSVVPTFQRQIAGGGPVTITHPDMERYFMSISEAVQLIIRAGTIGDKGEIFVLDMGEPIKISDLARDLIKLSGYTEDDIEIQYVGLRPGEKLFEEILIDEEKVNATNFEKIFIAPPVDLSGNEFDEKLKKIIATAKKGHEGEIIQGLREFGIGYSGDRPLA